MDGVTVVDHPLVQHKLTLMRKKDTSTARFRQLLREIATLLCYEVTRDLPLEPVEIETPVEVDDRPALDGQEAGVRRRSCAPASAWSRACWSWCPSARVGHIGLYRDPETLDAVEYYFNAPERRGRAAVHRHRSDAGHRQHRRRRASTG